MIRAFHVTAVLTLSAVMLTAAAPSVKAQGGGGPQGGGGAQQGGGQGSSPPDPPERRNCETQTVDNYPSCAPSNRARVRVCTSPSGRTIKFLRCVN